MGIPEGVLAHAAQMEEIQPNQFSDDEQSSVKIYSRWLVQKHHHLPAGVLNRGSW